VGATRDTILAHELRHVSVDVKVFKTMMGAINQIRGKTICCKACNDKRSDLLIDLAGMTIDYQDYLGCVWDAEDEPEENDRERNRGLESVFSNSYNEGLRQARGAEADLNNCLQNNGSLAIKFPSLFPPVGDASQ
jgi:hypothetical protein